MEQVDGEIDKIVNDDGIPLARIGLLGHGTGGCLALHLVYGAGRHARELGAVACERGFLANDSICYSAAFATWGSGGTQKPSPALFMGHGSEDASVQASWMDDTRSRLEEAGVRAPAKVVSYPGTGYDMCALELEQLVDFFVAHL